MVLSVKVVPSQIVLLLGIVTNGFGTIVIVLSETALIPQAEFPTAVSVKVTVPVCPKAGM